MPPSGDRSPLASFALDPIDRGIDGQGKDVLEQLHADLPEFRDRVLELIGRDLSGLVVDGMRVDDLEQTPMTSLDAKNILDAKGIRKITEQVSALAVRTNEHSRSEQRRLRRLEHEAKEQLIELERQQTDALARLREQTGSTLTTEQLEARLQHRLREMVEAVVKAAMADRAAVPPRDGVSASG